eukprot:TRINITY_DN6744_c0_g1_i1.p1 TRINITY_DN6744_c0_g1~~TRINITY_DN6744_c0_g1_i1.p1  ORF type:complete len:324 (-),score=89.02 TRINITY_DN6744_c0_g1_i1:19-894(-)
MDHQGEKQQFETERIAEKLVETKEECCLGIDEAGRGCVLGAMIYGCCYVAVKDKEAFSKMGFADSKQLTETKRDLLFDKIRLFDSNSPSKKIQDIGFIANVIEPQELSAKMLRINKVNLNLISHKSAESLIKQALDRGINVTEVYVDAVGPPAKYQAALKKIFPAIQITVANKADSLYPVVSAASICAKVIRDSRLKHWRFQEKVEISRRFNSGYPSDPMVKQWMKDSLDPIFGFPSFVRFSWKNCESLLDKSAAEVNWDRMDVDQYGALINQSDRFRYFADGNMEVVTDF